MLREVSQPLAWGSLLYCVPITTNSVTSKGTINEATVSVGQESGMAPPGPWAPGHSAAVQVILSAVPGPFPAHTAGGRSLVLWLEVEAPASLQEVSQGCLQLPGTPAVPSMSSSPGHSQDTPSLLSEKTWVSPDQVRLTQGLCL